MSPLLSQGDVGRGAGEGSWPGPLDKEASERGTRASNADAQKSTEP